MNELEPDAQQQWLWFGAALLAMTIVAFEPGRYRATTTKQAATSHVGARDLRLGGDPDPDPDNY